MTLRTATRGRNRGGQFWGCQDFPNCRGTRDYEEHTGKGEEVIAVPTRDHLTVEAAPRRARKVHWFDRTMMRPGWIARYAIGGGSLRSVRTPASVRRATETCWLAREDVPSVTTTSPDVVRVVSLVRKVLQRGFNPPLDPRSEVELLELLGFGDHVEQGVLPGDFAVTLRKPPVISQDEAWRSLPRGGTFDRAIELDSDEEHAFIGWMQDRLSEGSTRWLIPQGSLDLLLQAAGEEGVGDRRVDFLVGPPGKRPFVVEIDGSHHGHRDDADAERDRMLGIAGYPVFRVPVSELAEGVGPNLEAVANMWGDSVDAEGDLSALVWAPAQVHRFALGIVEGVEAGFLAGNEWTIQLEDPTGFAAHLVAPYLDLLKAMDVLWGDLGVSPSRVHLVLDGEAVTYEYDGLNYRRAAGSPGPPDLVLRLECNRLPAEELEGGDGRVPHIVVRSAFLSVDVSSPGREEPRRIPVSADRDIDHALTTILQSVFAKESFRPGQREAIIEILEGRDSAVLLPTGAGKSLIYQFAGLCLPGRTIVVAPIIALIEDQLLGLSAYGIDRTVAITSDRLQNESRESLFNLVASADALFTLIAPERLQTQEFRNVLQQMSTQTPINVAVVDEAHCVSEWGHQFRTSYLGLGEVIRTTCADVTGNPPPILALTGTASRAVLRDVLFQLGIEQRTANTLVRPESFDRPELAYNVHVTGPSSAEATLLGMLRSMPGRFSLPDGMFWQPRGWSTHCGIIFCQTVDGQRGVDRVANQVATVTGRRPPIYSGRAPYQYKTQDWVALKREAAAQFKANETPILVATSAFGMGIDKPNIRWIVHYGIPRSIEAYYQEAGRAGRDGGSSSCVVLLNEFDEQRSRDFLAENAELEELRSRMQEVRKGDRDDVTTALFFHLETFAGIEQEHVEAMALVDLLDPRSQARTEVVTFGSNSGDARERALHRLVVLGVISGYLVDWGAREYTVYVNGLEVGDVSRTLLRFVERSQPGRAPVIVDRLTDQEFRKLRDEIDFCGRLLIEFIYDVVEKSRRRSLREMLLAAREAREDGETLRTRILGYLHEGDIAPKLERLLDEEGLDWKSWREALDEITAVPDFRELRGTCARLLGSYPDHPGLLIGRSLAEVLDSEDGDLNEVSSNLRDALTFGRSRYGMDGDTSHAIGEWMLERAGWKRPAQYELLTDHELACLTVITAVLEKFPPSGESVDALLTTCVSSENPDPGLLVLHLRRVLQRHGGRTEALLDNFKEKEL